MNGKRFLSKITSPFFVPLRRFLVWLDDGVGTCNMKLTLAPRWDESEKTFKDTPHNQISELGKKISKDKANLAVWDDDDNDVLNEIKVGVNS
jgi:hypothetical protein